jgi:hypothetical protein
MPCRVSAMTTMPCWLKHPSALSLSPELFVCSMKISRTHSFIRFSTVTKLLMWNTLMASCQQVCNCGYTVRPALFCLVNCFVLFVYLELVRYDSSLILPLLILPESRLTCRQIRMGRCFQCLHLLCMLVRPAICAHLALAFALVIVVRGVKLAVTKGNLAIIQPYAYP